MSLLTRVQRGRTPKPPRLLVYGTPGIGSPAHLFTERLICTNGMISAEDVFRSTHVGAKHRGRDLTEILQLDTIQADGKATMLKLRDFARARFTPEQRVELIVRP